MWPWGFWQHRGQSQRVISWLTYSLLSLSLIPPLPLMRLLFNLIISFLSHSHFSPLSVAELLLGPAVCQTFFHTRLDREVPFFSILSFSMHLSSKDKVDFSTWLNSPLYPETVSWDGMLYSCNIRPYFTHLNQEGLCIRILVVKGGWREWLVSFPSTHSHHCAWVLYWIQQLIWYECSVYEVLNKRVIPRKSRRRNKEERKREIKKYGVWERETQIGTQERQRQTTREAQTEREQIHLPKMDTAALCGDANLSSLLLSSKHISPTPSFPHISNCVI